MKYGGPIKLGAEWKILEIRILASLWGDNFAEVLLRWSLPLLFSENNRQRVIASGYYLALYIYTDSSTLGILGSSEVRDRCSTITYCILPSVDLSQDYKNISILL